MTRKTRWLLNFSKMWSEFCFCILSIKKGVFLRKQGIKWPSNDFWRTPNWDLKSTIYLFIHKCTNWPNLYCNLLTLQNTSCSDWSWNLHITMHNRVFRGSKLHLMRMGNIKCKNNVDFFFFSISSQWGDFVLKQHLIFMFIVCFKFTLQPNKNGKKNLAKQRVQL